MLTNIEGLAYEVEGDQLTVEQDTGCGEMSMVLIHRVVFEEIGRVAGWLPSPVIVPSPVRTEALERDFRALMGRFYELFLDEALMFQIVEHCPRGMEVNLHLRAIQTLMDVVHFDLEDSREDRAQEADKALANQTQH